MLLSLHEELLPEMTPLMSDCEVAWIMGKVLLVLTQKILEKEHHHHLPHPSISRKLSYFHVGHA